jgi:chromosome segregation ATPase
MDDKFTTGPDDDKLSIAGLTWISKRLDTMAADLRELVQERRELSIMLRDLNRSIQRRAPELSPDRQALLDVRRDYASVWEMYAALQKRMDRMDLRLQEIERKLEPPLPPLPGFQP